MVVYLWTFSNDRYGKTKKEDLTLLQEFLALLKERGLHGLTAHLER